MSEANLVNEWIKAGARTKDGIRLFIRLRGETPFGRIVRRFPDGNSHLVIRALFRIAGKEVKEFVEVKEVVAIPLTIEATPAAPKFREQFPFLSEPTCPPELKILAADKITAYRNAVVAHQRLSDCKTLQECAITAQAVVDNWIENELIFEEFRYYGDMRKVLGKHPIFAEMKKIQELRKMPAGKIFKTKENLTTKINRIKYEIKKGDKPHLLAEREKRLRETEHLLAEVDRIIEGLS